MFQSRPEMCTDRVRFSAQTVAASSSLSTRCQSCFPGRRRSSPARPFGALRDATDSFFFVRSTARINKLCYGLDTNFLEPIEVRSASFRVATPNSPFFETSDYEACNLRCLRWSHHRRARQPRRRDRRVHDHQASWSVVPTRRFHSNPHSLLFLRVLDYAILAARIAISNLHKETKKTFSHVIEDLYSYGWSPLFSEIPHILIFLSSSQPQERTTLWNDCQGHLRDRHGQRRQDQLGRHLRS